MDFKKIIEFLTWFDQKHPEAIRAIRKRVNSAQKKDEELREIFNESRNDNNKKPAILAYVFQEFKGEDGLRRLEGFLSSTVDKCSDNLQYNAAVSLENLILLSLDEGLLTAEEFKHDAKRRKALKGRDSSAEIIELALEKNQDNNSSKELPSANVKYKKAFNHSYTVVQLQEIYSAVKVEIKKTTEEKFVTVMMGRNSEKINWTGSLSNLYRFVRYFCDEVELPKDSLRDSLCEVSKQIINGRRAEVPYQHKETCRVFEYHNGIPKIDKSKGIHYDAIHPLFKRLNKIV